MDHVLVFILLKNNCYNNDSTCIVNLLLSSEQMLGSAAPHLQLVCSHPSDVTPGKLLLEIPSINLVPLSLF